MHKDHLLQLVILMPHVSEKSVMIADNVKQQTFKVASSATKKDVKEAIEKLFEVDVNVLYFALLAELSLNLKPCGGKQLSIMFQELLL